MSKPMGKGHLTVVLNLFRKVSPGIIPALLAFLFSAGCLGIYSLSYKTHLNDVERGRLQPVINSYANTLSTVVNQRLALLKGINAFTRANHQNLNFANELAAFASALSAGEEAVRAFQFFPARGEVLVFPVDGNQETLGRTLEDLLHDKRTEVRLDVAKTLQSSGIIISGPYELRQGGLGFVARLAVRRETELLGLAVIVVDLPPLIDMAGLKDAARDELAISLRDKAGRIIWGAAESLEDPLTLSVNLADSEWMMSLAPQNGWASRYAFAMNRFYLVSVLLSILAALTAFAFFDRYAWLEISVRKRTRKLQEKAVNLTERVKGGRIGLWHWDMVNDKVHYSAEWKAQIGYRENEISNDFKEWESRVHPDDLSRTRSILERTIAECSDDYSVEFRFRHKDGSWRWISARGAVLTNAEGQAIRMVGSHVDITDNKKETEDLRDSEKRAISQRQALVELTLQHATLKEDLDQSLKKLVRIMSQTLDMARTSIWLLSPDRKVLQCQVLYEVAEEQYSHGAELQTDSFPEYFEAIRADNRVFVEDAQNDPRTAGLRDNYLIPLGITSLLDAGIFLNGELTGVVSFEHIGKQRTWHADEESFVISLASLVAQWLSALEKAKAEDILREREDRLRAMFEEAPTGIALIDSVSGKMMEANKRYAEIVGLTREEITSMDWMSITHPDDVQKDLEHMARLRAGEIPGFTLQKRYFRPDKSIVWVILTVARLKTRGNEPLRHLAIVQDITEQKASEAQLQGSMEETKRLLSLTERSRTALLSSLEDRKLAQERVSGLNTKLETLIEVVKELSSAQSMKRVETIIDRAGRELFDARKVLVAYTENREYCRFAGATEDPDSENSANNGPILMQDCLEGQAIMTGGEIVVRDIAKDNRFSPPAFHLADYASGLSVPVNRENPLGALGIYWVETHNPTRMEISLLETMADAASRAIDNIRLYAELEQRVQMRTEQLKAVNKELETFTYSVSHDLKAPLRGIDGYSKLLEDQFAGKLDGDARLFITNIRNSTRQMNQLIDDLLQYSRLERSSSRIEWINIREMLQSLLSLYQDEMKQGSFKVTNSVPDIRILADSRGLQIALRNLIGNAIKFSSGPERKPAIQFTLQDNEDSWVLAIQDNGIGFDMKYHNRIFEIFQRLHRQEDYGGTGVGLAMVVKAMQKMSGSVWATGEPGNGAVFYLKLPKNMETNKESA